MNKIYLLLANTILWGSLLLLTGPWCFVGGLIAVGIFVLGIKE